MYFDYYLTFQFLLVRLKVASTCELLYSSSISIPTGTIKSRKSLSASAFRAYISIPTGTIKRNAFNKGDVKIIIFQFLLVRLKV